MSMESGAERQKAESRPAPHPAQISFRFQGLEIWRRAAAIRKNLFLLAEALDKRKYFRFAEQLRAATLSITNNIAEGSGSNSRRDFANFLNSSRRSVFDVVNMLLLFVDQGYLDKAEVEQLLPALEEESRMLIGFMRKLTS